MQEDKREETPSKISMVSASSRETESPFSVLEQAFAAYVLALQSRSGNIVGRTLRARENVDRSAVNELYNVLLEDPSRIQMAAEVPVVSEARSRYVTPRARYSGGYEGLMREASLRH